MVLGYTEIEITYAHIAGLALGLKWEVLNASEKVFSETQKIKMIHALCRRAFEKTGLAQEYHTAHKMTFFCATLRNSYAHCQWVRNHKARRLEYYEGTENFESRDAFMDHLQKHPLSLRLLKQHAAYFQATREWLLWLEATIENRAKPSAERVNYVKPKEMPQPPKHYSPPSRRRARKKTGRPGKPSKPA